MRCWLLKSVFWFIYIYTSFSEEFKTYKSMKNVINLNLFIFWWISISRWKRYSELWFAFENERAYIVIFVYIAVHKIFINFEFMF